MYIVSDKLAKAPVEIKRLGDKLPKSYQDFLGEYGIGIYRGVLRVKPDDQHLTEYTQDDFWDFHESIPITREQLEECTILVASEFGDYIAFHPKVNQLLLLPRHSEKISLIAMDANDFCKTLNTILSYIYSEPFPPVYFEPLNQGRKLEFMRFEASEFATIRELAKRYYELFPPDFLIEEDDEYEYSCEVFRKQFGGYVSFGHYQVSVRYDEDKSQQVEATLQFLGEYVR